eukprot:gb/GEZN01000100.1/.p1 GENE.gb/GEZN01000100.1/~~gb/GEZN01000100.1/.p1  ORF type:complete len:2286 (-),score=407.39 gb/GEZN01000100.1/:245-7102(-)
MLAVCAVRAARQGSPLLGSSSCRASVVYKAGCPHTPLLRLVRASSSLHPTKLSQKTRTFVTAAHVPGQSGELSKEAARFVANVMLDPTVGQGGVLKNPHKLDQFPLELSRNEERAIREGTLALSPLAQDILSRIDIGGMSAGSLSFWTHGKIARATEAISMALANVSSREALIDKLHKSGYFTTSNSGEGGDCNRHLVHQIASARFGVVLDYIAEAAILQFKAAQGVKPGTGGALSGIKVTEMVAFLRHTEPWTDLYSPAPHHDQYSIEDFAQIVCDYSSANPRVGWSCKLASEPGVHTIALGVAKAMGLSEKGMKCNIEITGQGATGNTPLLTKYHAVFPWIIGLTKTHHALVVSGMRDSVTLTASGGFVGDLSTAFLFGADKVALGSLGIIGDGCAMVRVCEKNICPTGVATLDPELIAKNKGTALSIARLLWAVSSFTAKKIEPYFDTVDKAIGRAPDVLEAIENGPLSGHDELLTLLRETRPKFISLGGLPPRKGPSYSERSVIEAIRGGQTEFEVEAKNSDMSWGGRIGYFSRTDPKIAQMLRTRGVVVRFKGLATGQSFGVLSPEGLTLVAKHTNDGTGKSMDGAHIFCQTCGNHAGMGMTNPESFLATRGLNNRGAVRKSGGTLITEYAGSFFGNFHTRGTTMVLGDASHYPGLLLENAYKPPFLFKDCALGPGFASGFTGGKFIMPRKLWDEISVKKHISQTIIAELEAEPLCKEDKDELIAKLTLSVKHLDSDLQRSLLKAITADVSLVDEWLVKLDPPHVKALRLAAARGKKKPDSKPELGSVASETGLAPDPLLNVLGKIRRPSILPTQGRPPPFPFRGAGGRPVGGRGISPPTSASFPAPLKTMGEQIDAAEQAVKAELAKVDRELENMREKDEQAMLGEPVFSDTKKAGVAGLTNGKELVPPVDKDRAACGTGLVMHLDGIPSHKVLQLSIGALAKSEHRGAAGGDPLSGDGCGALLFFGPGFFENLPEFKDLNLVHQEYGILQIYMPTDEMDFQQAEVEIAKIFQQNFADSGQERLAKRKVPINVDLLGVQARADKIELYQYIMPKPPPMSLLEFDEQLVLTQMVLETVLHGQHVQHTAHSCSFSRRYVVFKTRGRELNFRLIFPDLMNPNLTASMGITHARFATNTDTLIQNVQPLWWACFNGEVNNIVLFLSTLKYNPTLRGIIDVSDVELNYLSDSNLMARYIKMLRLGGLSPGQVHDCIFHPYSPTESNFASTFHNLMGFPGLEGPNASIRVDEAGSALQVWVELDRMGWRPHRGVIDQKSRLLVTGSELGIVPDVDGDIISLGPAEAIVINPNKGTIEKYAKTEKEQQVFEQKLANIDLMSSQYQGFEYQPMSFSPDELKQRKLWAGLTPELEQVILNPLYHGKPNTVSMGDGGPLEVVATGSTRPIYMIKTDFAQITRPPLDNLREGEFMSARTFIGRRPNFKELTDDNWRPQGYYLDNPIVDNEQMQQLLSSSVVKPIVLDCTYNVRAREDAIVGLLRESTSKAIDSVRNKGINVVVFSDVKTTHQRATVFPMLISGFVDLALREAGLREQTTLILQSAMAVTPLELIVQFSLGIDLVNPYLIFAPDALYQTDRAAFSRQRNNYRKMAMKDVMAALARCGISTLSGGYRGARLIKALGLDEDIANGMGIHSELGGYDWASFASSAVDAHLRPKADGLGKYRFDGQTSRQNRLNVKLVRDWLAIAGGTHTLDELYNEMNENVTASAKDNIEGWYKLKPPTRWTFDNPMTVIIVGGGAAGFQQARSLLSSSIGTKVRIKMIEENPGNRFGLVTDGIAPDKHGTKDSQHKLLGLCLQDARFEYYGGVQVGEGGDVTFAELNATYPCVIDCRGAPHDRLLTHVEGHELFIPASRVWKAYNGFFDPFNPTRYWPFPEHSRSQVCVVVGNGNVSADIIRTLLNRQPNYMHPSYEARIGKQGPKFVRNIARGSVLDCKISLKELESFERNGIMMFATFDEPNVDESSLEEEDAKKLAFFRRARAKKPTLKDGPRVHFHFGCSPTKIYPVGKRNILEMQVVDQHGKTECFRGSAFISAIGKAAPKAREAEFVSGWATGEGGNLTLAQNTVDLTTEQILKLDEKNYFDNRMGPAAEMPWQLRASVTSKGYSKILKWCADGNALDTVRDWRLARDYTPFEVEAPGPEQEEEGGEVIAPKAASVGKGLVGVIGLGGEIKEISIKGKEEQTAYSVLKANYDDGVRIPMPGYECGGAGTCSTCAVDVSGGKQPLVHTALGDSLRATMFGKSAKQVAISCQLKAAALEGAVIRVKNPQ